MTQISGGPTPPGFNPVPSSNPVDSSFLANNQAIQDSIVAAESNPLLGGGTPRLSILEFAQKVSEGILSKKEADKAYDLNDSTSYRELHVAITISALKLKEKILSLINFQQDYTEFIDTTHARTTANDININHGKLTNFYSDVYELWSKMADARLNANNNFPNINAIESAIIQNDYIEARNKYNTRINDINTIIGRINTDIIAGRAAQGSDVDKYNQLIIDLGIDLPLMKNLNDVPTLTPFPSAPLSPPPPWPLGLQWKKDENGNKIIEYPYTSSGLPYIGPPPAKPPAANLPVPVVLSDKSFSQTYIKPLELALKALADLLEKSKVDTATYTVFKLVFGQATPGEVESLPFANVLTPVGTGGSSQLGASAPNKAQNPNLAANMSQAKLDAIFAKFGVGTGSPLIALIGGVPEDLLEALRALAIPKATDLANNGFVGSTPEKSPIIGAAVALNSLDEAVKFLDTGSLEKVVFDKLITQKPEELKSLSEEDLVKLAKGITAALSLEVIQLVVLDAAQAIGTSGLLPQLLASIGGVSSDTILKFINGLVNFQLLDQSPLGLELVKNTFSNELQGSLDIKQSDVTIKNALDSFINQGPFLSEEASKAALRQSLNQAMVYSGIPVDEAKTYVDKGFDRIENPTKNLSPQQQLQDQLKLTSFNDEIKQALQNSELEKDESERISRKIENSIKDIGTLDERKQIVANILTKERVDDPRGIIDLVSKTIDSPLRNFLVSEPAPIQTLLSNFVFEASRLLVSQGIPKKVAAEQSENFAKIIYDNPTSIASLTARYLEEYSQAVGVDQAKAVADNFSHVMLPTRDLAIALAKNQANGIVFASNPIINGTSSMQKVGTGGGVPMNPIIG